MLSWLKTLSRSKANSERATPPIPLDELRGLFECLDKPNPTPCTHTFLETTEFLKSRSLPVTKTLEWLGANGSGCDCEVIFNVSDEWGECVGWSPKDEE